MSITISELASDIEKYVELAHTEDILITTETGFILAKLTNAIAEKLAIVESLVGILPSDITMEDAIEERLSRL